MYLYPENLTARPMLWLWTLRDVAWIGTGLLLSVLALTQTGSMIPLVITAALAFLCIRHGGISMLDFLRYAGVSGAGTVYRAGAGTGAAHGTIYVVRRKNEESIF